MEEDPLAVSAPQANAYEFQSSGIVDMLEKLKDKFEDERTDLEKEESNARHAYEMLIQDLTVQIETATEDREAKAHGPREGGEQRSPRVRDVDPGPDGADRDGDRGPRGQGPGESVEAPEGSGGQGRPRRHHRHPRCGPDLPRRR